MTIRILTTVATAALFAAPALAQDVIVSEQG